MKAEPVKWDTTLPHTKQVGNVRLPLSSYASSTTQASPHDSPKTVTKSWIGNERLVTQYNCEEYGMNDYCFDKYGMAMGLDHWWGDVLEDY